MSKVIVGEISSLDGYYEGQGGNVTGLPMDASFDDYNLEGPMPSWSNQAKVTLQGIHYVQEDSQAEIGMALSEFITALSKVGDAWLTSARHD